MKPLYLILLLLLAGLSVHAQISPTFSDLDYVGNNHLRQAIDLYVPSGVQDPAPVVVYIHGGGWKGGNKGYAMKHADSLLAAGYFVADISYRLSSDSIWPAQIEDCKAAIKYLKLNAERFGIDSSRVGVMGHSAGGHLAAMLACGGGAPKLEGVYMRGMGVKSGIHAAIDFFGPTNFLRMDEYPPEEAWNCKRTIIHNDPESPEGQLLGCAVPDCPERVVSADPATYINGDEPPVWIVHGEQDCLVPIDQSEYLYKRLREAGTEVEFTRIAKAGHGGKAFTTPEMRGKIRAFFDEHLRE